MGDIVVQRAINRLAAIAVVRTTAPSGAGSRTRIRTCRKGQIAIARARVILIRRMLLQPSDRIANIRLLLASASSCLQRVHPFRNDILGDDIAGIAGSGGCRCTENALNLRITIVNDVFARPGSVMAEVPNQNTAGAGGVRNRISD